MDEHAAWIRAARLASGLTQDQLAVALGCTKANVSAWETGRHLAGPHQLHRIAELAGRPRAELDYLLGFEPDEPASMQALLHGGVAPPPAPPPRPPPPTALLPLQPLEPESECYCELPEKWLLQILGPARVSSLSALRVLRVEGDTMSPTIEDDDLVLVDTGHCDALSDGLYVVQPPGERPHVRRLQRRPGGAVVVLADNTHYERVELPAADAADLHIAGRAVLSWRTRRF